MGFESETWNFFESGNGKVAPDAVGGSVKWHADADTPLPATGSVLAGCRLLKTVCDGSWQSHEAQVVNNNNDAPVDYWALTCSYNER